MRIAVLGRIFENGAFEDHQVVIVRQPAFKLCQALGAGAGRDVQSLEEAHVIPVILHAPPPRVKLRRV